MINQISVILSWLRESSTPTHVEKRRHISHTMDVMASGATEVIR
jgi:hypothetical protein